MIINDKAAASRLNSPLNLINRLKDSNNPRKSAMSLFIPEKKIVTLPSFNPFIQTQSDIPETKKDSPEEATSLSDILENHESQIQLGLAHDNAIKLLNASVSMLSAKLDDVSASKLPAVISAASKTVESIRKERSEAAKNNKDREVHYHFYTPQQNKISDYEVIDVV